MLENKKVWITGASSGIGEALAYEYANAGAIVLLSARSVGELNRVKSACKNPEKHHVIPLDLGQYHNLEERAETVWDEYGPIDILIHNGGQGQYYLVQDSSFEVDKKIMDVNFLGTIALNRPILKKMLQRQSGQIAVVSSLTGLFGLQGKAAYSASKHALKGYFESLRNELYRTNIQITLIYPGYIKTNLTRNALIATGVAYGNDSRKIGISPKDCAERIVKAIEHKKAVLIVAGARERFGVFLWRFLPCLFRLISPRMKD